MSQLFDQHARRMMVRDAPLAARMRPRVLDEYVGQDHIVGPGRLLRRAIETDQLSSLIFYGPPGTGKTTLARIIANTTRAHFIALNAVLAGVKDIRTAIQAARDRLGQFSQRTILFVDEVHRFNKAQQDALLPWVENGTVVLIGATTENPYFEVNKALVSRSRVFQLVSLNKAALRLIAQHCVEDVERGFGEQPVRLRGDALEHLVNVANGDARGLLNALELAIETTPAVMSSPPFDEGDLLSPAVEGSKAIIDVDLAVAEESIQQRAVLYDKEGDAHFDTISAFIKSVRGSDPDASLYWLAKMVQAGEDPRYLFRRLIILASEDIGLADPNAIGVVNACAQAFDRIGMPEGRFPLSQATIYLATAPKSNSTMAFFDALRTVATEGDDGVPNHLKDGSRDKESFGHGDGYLYPHAYRDHWVAQQYLPSALQGRTFYTPSDQGFEGGLKLQIDRRREAQVAAMVEGLGLASVEILTYSPEDRSAEGWLQRTVGQAGQRLSRIRDAVFEVASIERHSTILDLNAGTGLLTWEALRRAPEGFVFSAVVRQRDADAIEGQARVLPELRRPELGYAPVSELRELVEERHPGLRFERLVGRSAFVQEPDKIAVARALFELASRSARLILAESVPRRVQRIYDLVVDRHEDLDSDLLSAWREAEEAIYDDPGDAMVNWDVDDLAGALAEGGWQVESPPRLLRLPADVRVTEAVLSRWFDPLNGTAYSQRLAASLDPEQVAAVEAVTRRTLSGKTVRWESTTALIVATPLTGGADQT